MSDLISITNLSKSFGSYKAVDNLNLSIKKGDFFGFLGPNGAGKTTAIRLITGIYRPDSGNIFIDGLPQTEKIKIAHKLGTVPESRGFYEWMNAIEYLSFFATIYGVPKNKITKKINQLLSQVVLTEHKHQKIGTYSRGMKQRLSLARALVNDPQILILDEPTIGLDPKGQEDIENLLKELNKQGVTIIYSSHILPEVSNLCSRLAIINHGHLVAQGTVNEIIKSAGSKDLTEAFLNLTNS